MTAFNCTNCPEHNNIQEGGCPMWWEDRWEYRDPTDKTGGEEVKRTQDKKGCGANMIREYLHVAVNTMEIPVGTLSEVKTGMESRLDRIEQMFLSVNNDMFKGLLQIAQAFDNRNQEVQRSLIDGLQSRVLELENQKRLGNNGNQN